MKNKLVVTFCEHHRITSDTAHYEHGSRKWGEREHDHTCTNRDNFGHECNLKDVNGMECPGFREVQYRADENCMACGCRYHWESKDFDLAQCKECGLTFAL